MSNENEVLEFDWNTLGDVQVGRGSLGQDMPVVVYRLMQFTLKAVLSKKFGEEEACGLLRDAGRTAGVAFAKNVLDTTGELDFFITDLKNKLREFKIGILRVEEADAENMSFILTVSEDLDCSGLPVSGDTVCDYDEGFIAGILETYTNVAFNVKEIDCWATGDRTCRFEAKAK